MAEGEPKQETPAPAPPAEPTNPAIRLAQQPPPDWQVNLSLPNIPYELGAISPSLRPPQQPYGPPSPSEEFQPYAPRDRFTPTLPNSGNSGNNLSVDLGRGFSVSDEGITGTLNTPLGPGRVKVNEEGVSLRIPR